MASPWIWDLSVQPSGRSYPGASWGTGRWSRQGREIRGGKRRLYAASFGVCNSANLI